MPGAAFRAASGAAAKGRPCDERTALKHRQDSVQASRLGVLPFCMLPVVAVLQRTTRPMPGASLAHGLIVDRRPGAAMIVCGVDDAGRGSMIGPLVIAGVSIRRDRIVKLRDIGVRDSKVLTPARRNELYAQITSVADGWCVSRIAPSTIDRSVSKHRLNALEAKYMAKAIARLGPGVAYVDSCDVNARRFGEAVSSMAGGGGGRCAVQSHHKADSRFEVVAAASIIAKVTRDREIAKIAQRHGGRDAVGSGYPSDRRTVWFVEKWIARGRGAPPFARSSWKPVRMMLMDARWGEWSKEGQR